MRFRVLGSVGVEVKGRYRGISGSRQRTLLASLLVSNCRPVPAEQLYAELWGERPPSTVENSLQAHVYRLRRTLQELAGSEGTAPPLITRAPGYVLDIQPEDLDLNVFRERTARARQALATDPGRAYTHFEEALDLWRGSPLQDVSLGPLCQSVALQLEEEHLSALEEKLWLGIDHDDPNRVIGELKRVSTVHPWRERITEMLMLALYRCGRQAEAVAAYNSVRSRLVDELGMEPSKQLELRFREILNQAPSLQLSSLAR
ncbi:SARP family transcriptional regulator [Streptomyces griseoflavus]|uniref:AfsR/SARP family transcriptional regulator n=1 Tax=Streptomyces rimosus TaxID=1927 RepID=UPI000517F13D|nr:AfsR/SARP family transcriptional regulator [Streptomyces rimosus]KOG64541.1 SARP family transcriptional regulator [Streptomyces griseoflavus]